MRYIWKQFFAALLSVVLAFALLPGTAWAEDDPFENAGGDGSAGSPYLISTKEQLKSFGAYVSAGHDCTDMYIELSQDIDLENEEWAPVGRNYDSYFNGVFDGKGHTVSGLSVTKRSSFVPSGMFKNLDLAGTIKNLGVSGSVTGDKTVGGIVGENHGGTIENCHFTGTVSSLYGGLADVGGIVGKNSGTIRNCYNSGAVNFQNARIGGIAGVNQDGAIENCYNTGAVVGNRAGGIVGYNSGLGKISTVKSCYNTGKVSGVTTGGISGSNSSDDSIIENCYYLAGTAENGTSDGDSVGTTAKAAAEFRFLASTLGEGWADSVEGRPVLLSNKEVDPVSETAPYEIPDKETLEAFREYVNAGNNCAGMYFEVTKNIDLEGSEQNPWTPIGNEHAQFKGTFDGGEHTISGLYINNRSENQGLFGYIGEGGTVKDLTVSGKVSGGDSTGGIVGQCRGSLENCHNTATINGGEKVGGVAGLVESNGSVKNCSNTGTVNGSRNIGGVGGYINGTIENCYNTGDVSCTVMNAGGVVGFLYGGTVKNCYNTAAVNGRSSAGGIVGNSKKTVQFCYNYAVTAGSNYGAIVKYGFCTDCYYLTGTVNSDKKGAVEKSAAEFRFLASALNGDEGEVWADSVLGRPVLKSNPEADIISGDVPYEIPDADTMKAFRDYINGSSDGGEGKTFKLTKDIDLAGSENDPWTPIGNNDKPFHGTFDGGNFTVSGLYIKASDDYQGLFGYIGLVGTVKNLTVEGNVTGKLNVAGIAGQNDGRVENCHNICNVSGTAGCGGVVGMNNPSGTVANCYNTGDITGMSSIGGIVGSGVGGTVDNCYNTGNISDGSNLGGIAGYNSGSTVTNCYYLDTAPKGIGDGDGEATPKSAENFSSGEVAWLLQGNQEPQVWGQTLSSDNYPVLTGEAEKKVYKVTFATNDNHDYDAKYANLNGTVALPADPTLTGMIFDHWSKTQGTDGEKFDDTTQIAGDITVYAVGRQTFGGGIDAPLSIHEGYSNNFSVDLDIFMAYQSGNPAAGKFDYEIASDANGTKASLSGSTLTVPTGLKPGTYEITVTAKEKAPDYALMSVESYGVEPVTLTVQVVIGPHIWSLKSTDEATGSRTYTCGVCNKETVVESGKYFVSGEVTESDGKTPSVGAGVTLKRGGETVAQSATDSNGRYYFPGVEPGIYNLVVGEGDNTTTVLVEVTGDTPLDNITELPENVSSKLEVTGDDTPAVVVGGLDKEAQASAEANKAVTVTMTVEAVTDGAAGNTQDLQDSIDAIKSKSESSGHEYLDLTVEKTVSDAGGTSTTGPLTETKQPLTVILSFDFTGKSNIVVYRYHGAAVDKLTEAANTAGEYIELDPEGGMITLHVKNFSTYAIGYTVQTAPTSYAITVPQTEHGTLTADRRSAIRGRAVTLTATPDEGCHLASLTVTDRRGKPVELTDNGDGTYTFTQPSGRVTIAAQFVPCPTLGYADLDAGAWYHDCTDYVITNALMRGVADGIFDPDGAVTRAQMVTVLWNMRGDPVVNYYMTCADVTEADWYAEAVRWAASEGIAGGYGDGNFGPDDPITREQMAVMLYRYEQKFGSGGFTGQWSYRLPFTDLEDISDWAFEAVAWCNMKGIITGKDENIFDPKGPAKRSEMAAILTRYGQTPSAQ